MQLAVSDLCWRKILLKLNVYVVSGGRGVRGTLLLVSKFDVSGGG